MKRVLLVLALGVLACDDSGSDSGSGSNLHVIDRYSKARDPTVFVIHDEAHKVTCWAVYNGTSCMPDWYFEDPPPDEPPPGHGHRR